MSRRTRHFRGMMGKDATATAQNILARNSTRAVSEGRRTRFVDGQRIRGTATGLVGTLPMRDAKAVRLAKALHHTHS